MKKYYCINLMLCLAMTMTGVSCSKSDFLDAKPQTNLVVPSTIADFQALLEGDQLGTATGTFTGTPSLGEVSADNYYYPSNLYPSLTNARDKNAYIWTADIYAGAGNQTDWNQPYKQIFYANVVIDGMSRISITASNQQAWGNTYGYALFIRGYAYWNLAQLYAPPYDSVTANTDLGLPIKLSPDINKIAGRSSVQQTYDQVISDLKAAIQILPTSFTGHLNRGSKPAVYALLARTYLSMRAYNKALLYSDSALQTYNALIDYYTLSTTASQPFAAANVETMYNSVISNAIFVSTTNGAVVDTVLLKSYATNDLRGTIFFRTPNANGTGFKFGYEGPGTASPSSGPTTSEMYLIRSECNARAGNSTAAMNDLNTLLVTRWKKNGSVSTFVPFTASSNADALSKVLTERRKELVFRSLRWMDLRRLNKEGYNITLMRNISGQIYTLAPNSPLYVLPIPADEIALSGIQQNPR